MASMRWDKVPRKTVFAPDPMGPSRTSGSSGEPFAATYAGVCYVCRKRYRKGQSIRVVAGVRGVFRHARRC